MVITKPFDAASHPLQPPVFPAPATAVAAGATGGSVKQLDRRIRIVLCLPGFSISGGRRDSNKSNHRDAAPQSNQPRGA